MILLMKAENTGYWPGPCLSLFCDVLGLRDLRAVNEKLLGGLDTMFAQEGWPSLSLQALGTTRGAAAASSCVTLSQMQVSLSELQSPSSAGDESHITDF